MFKVLFVDDEDIIREGFKSRIPWRECGYDFCGTFDDGSRVIEYLKDNTVDLIISDICMPKVDGLELSRFISEKYPSIKILLLTGYDEFEYAREAIKYESILELILKPVTSAEFTKILEKTASVLFENQQEIRDRELLKEKLQKSFPLLKKRFLYRMAGGHMSLEEWNQRKDFIQVCDKEKCYQLIIVGVNPDEDEISRLEKEEIINSLMADGDELFQNRDEQIVLFLQGEDPEKLASSTSELAEKLTSRLQSIAGKTAPTLGIGQIVQEVDKINISYVGAKNSLSYQLLTGSTGIRHISTIRDKNRPGPEWRSDMEISFKRILHGEKTEKAEELIDSYFRDLKEYYITSGEASLYSSRLFFILLEFIEEADLLSAKKREELLEEYNKHQKEIRLDEESLWLKKKIREISSVVKEKRARTSYNRLSKAKQLLEENYMVFDYSLHKLCSELYISSSHFSAFFKEGTGKTFVEYLTSLRIEKAKILLKTTELKTYEIAEKVGYRDPRYFSMIFKKGTSMTTSEFRSSLK